MQEDYRRQEKMRNSRTHLILLVSLIEFLAAETEANGNNLKQDGLLGSTHVYLLVSNQNSLCSHTSPFVQTQMCRIWHKPS